MEKTAYLTIDDSPSGDMQRKIDFLKSKNIPAIFFCEGRFLEEKPEPAINAIKNGFIIGNHSYNHPRFSQLDLKACFHQIDQTDAIITNLYKKAGVQRHHWYFRFPYGDQGAGDRHPTELLGKNTQFRYALQQHLKKKKYQQPQFKGITYDWYVQTGLLNNADVYWTFDTLDWVLTEEQPKYGIKTLKDVLDRIGQKNHKDLNAKISSEIILMHDHDKIAGAFVPIIEKLLSHNLHFAL